MAIPVDNVVVGQALNDRGAQAFNTIEGLGLNTFGFLWPCTGIWTATDNLALTTTWVTPTTSVVLTETCLN